MNTLHVIADLSGSMSENGKDQLIRSILKTIQNFFLYEGRNREMRPAFYRWQADVQQMDLSDENGHAVPKAESRAELAGLIRWFQERSNNAPVSKVLILSDGGLCTDDYPSISVLKTEFPTLRVDTIRIGADADSHALRKLSVRGETFDPVNVLAALDRATLSVGSDRSFPRSLTDLGEIPSQSSLLEISPSDPEGGWDD